MPDSDGIVKIGTAVDVSSLKSGMDQAASTVQSSSDRMASALQQVRVATKSLADAQLQLGQAAVQGNTQAAAVIAEYESALSSARTELASLSETQVANTAIVSANTAALAINATATRSVTGSYYAAQGAAALFQGRIPIRAMERFLASSTGVSSALRVAFPVIGAIALAEILAELVRHLYDAYEKYVSLNAAAQAFEDTVEQLRNRDLVDVRSIEDANLRVQKLNSSAQELLDTSKQLQQQSLGGGNLFQAFAVGGLLGAAKAAYQLREARKDADEGYQKKTQANEIDLKSIELNHQIAVAKIEAAHAGDSALDGLQKINAEEQKRISLIQEEQSYNKSRDQALRNPVSANSGSQLASLQEATAKGEAAAARATLAAREAQEALRKAEENTKIIFGNKNPEIPKLQEKYNTKAAEDAARGILVMEKADAEVKKWAADTSTALSETGEKWAHYHELVERGAEIEAQASSQTQLARVAAEEASKSITPLAAAEKTAAIHAEEYRLKLQLLEEELKRLKAAADTDPVTGQYTNPEQAGQIQQTQNSITQLQGNRGVQQIQDQSAVQQQIAQPWLNAFQQINQGWLQVQNQMLFSTQNLSVAFAKMGQSIFISIVDSMEQAVLKAAEHDLLMVATHQAANNAKVTSDTVAAAQSDAVKSSSALKQLYLEITGLFHHQATNTAKVTSDAATHAAQQSIDAAANATAIAQGLASNQVMAQSNAAVAATAALAQTANPAYAAAIYGIAESFAALASFDVGTGYVPKTGLAVLHQGEAVIPAPTMKELRGDDGGGGSPVTIHQNNTYNGFKPDREFQRQLYRNASHVAGAIKQHLRQGGKG